MAWPLFFPFPKVQQVKLKELLEQKDIAPFHCKDWRCKQMGCEMDP